jgi:hypothetical protein
MRVCQSSQGQQGTCGFFGSGGYLLYEITEGQVRQQTNPVCGQPPPVATTRGVSIRC